MELVVRRLITMRWRTIWSAVVKARSTAALLPSSWRKAWLSGHSSHTGGAPGATASAAEVTAGSGSYSTSIASAASLASAMVSATIKATGSPT